jgi:hypothetical protein
MASLAPPAPKVLTIRIEAWENLKTSVVSSHTGQPGRWKVGRLSFPAQRARPLDLLAPRS